MSEAWRTLAVDAFWRAHDEMDLIGPPRTDDEIQRGPIYTLPDPAILSILKQLYMSELDTHSQDGGLGAAKRALNRACVSVNLEFRRICRKSSETFTSSRGVETGPAYLRNRLFVDIFEEMFNDKFPGFKDQGDAIYGVFDAVRQRYMASFHWEKFFKRAYFALTVLRRDIEVNFTWNPMEKISYRFNNDTGVMDDDFEFAEFGVLYSTLLYHYRPRLALRFPYRDTARGTQVYHRTEEISGAELAKRVFLYRLEKQFDIDNVVRMASGTIFDGRRLFDAINELVVANKITWQVFAAGWRAENQVRTAFAQNGNVAIWMPLLDMPLANERNFSHAVPHLALDTYLFLISLLGLGNSLTQVRTAQLVKRYALHITSDEFRSGRPETEEKWALDYLFQSVNTITVDELPRILRLTRNSEDYKRVFRINSRAELWRPLLLAPSRMTGTYISFWLAYELYRQDAFTKAELHTLYDHLDHYHISNELWFWIKGKIIEVFGQE